MEDYHPVPLKQVNLVGDIRQLLQDSAGPHPVAGTGHQPLLDVKVVVLLVLHLPG